MSEHRAGGSSQGSHTPPAPCQAAWLSPTLYGDSPCWSRASRAGPAAASRSRQAARHCTAVQLGHSWLTHFSPALILQKSKSSGPGGHCQGALHLSQERGWKILMTIDPCCVLLLSLYLRTSAKISAFSLIPVFQQQLWLC